MSKHLAVFRQPFLDLILEGKKTIESRFAKVRCAPHGVIETGDIVLLKKTGWSVYGEFTVDRVESFTRMQSKEWEALKKYSKEICSDRVKNFWEMRAESNYVTLVWIKDVKRYKEPLV